MDEEILVLMDSLGEFIPEVIEKLAEDDLICECFCVNAAMVREICPNHIDLTLLREKLNLGNGCQDCLKRKEDWINRVL
jgi:hypothetical protein